MKPLDELILDDLERYEGPHRDLIIHAPALYRLLTHLLADPALPGRLRPLILAAVAYFILPADILPEDLRGPSGYVDDLFLCAFMANRVLQETASETLLTENWDGTTPLMPLLADILAREADLIGDHRPLILWFIGYDFLSPETGQG